MIQISNGVKKIVALTLGVMLLAAACNKNKTAENPSPTPPAVVNPTPPPTENPTPPPTNNPNPSVSPTPNPALATSAEIKIISSGFSPANVIVKKGAKVTFVNNSVKLSWPASDPHPTHTDLPGFDSKKGLKNGESYTFTFNQVGTWGFHDHLNSSFRGKVIVQE
jgi:plastocyanin